MKHFLKKHVPCFGFRILKLWNVNVLALNYFERHKFNLCSLCKIYIAYIHTQITYSLEWDHAVCIV